MNDEASTYHVRLASGQRYGPADIATVMQWASQGRIPRDAVLVPDVGGEPCPVMHHPRLSPILNAPPTVAGPMPVKSDGGAVSALIPYRNPPALIGYYVAVAALIPVLGLILGPVAMILGFAGLRRRTRDRASKGLAHAWVAIVLGGLVLVAHVVLILALVLSR